MSKKAKLEDMLKAGMHFGHKTSKWHPKMKPYIFTSRKGVHIIDLTKTQELLDKALDFMVKTISEDKTVLFVGTKSQVKVPMQKMCEEIKQPFVVGKWLGGLLTNFPVIRKSIKKYVDLVDKKESGKLSKYSKKEQVGFDKEIQKLKLRVGGLVDLKKTPDAIFIWDIKKEKTALDEANKMKIPVIAICDTNTNPTGIKYPIPSNDDATKTIKFVLNLIGETIKEAQSKRK